MWQIGQAQLDVEGVPGGRLLLLALSLGLVRCLNARLLSGCGRALEETKELALSEW